jgi:hypothetical protein
MLKPSAKSFSRPSQSYNTSLKFKEDKPIHEPYKLGPYIFEFSLFDSHFQMFINFNYHPEVSNVRNGNEIGILCFTFRLFHVKKEICVSRFV